MRHDKKAVTEYCKAWSHRNGSKVVTFFKSRRVYFEGEMRSLLFNSKCLLVNQDELKG